MQQRLSGLCFFFFLLSSISTTTFATAFSTKPFLDLDLDAATTLCSGDNPALPPMVSVPCLIVNNNSNNNHGDDTVTTTASTSRLRELVKPPAVDDLYAWYVQCNQTPDADPSWATVWPTAVVLANFLLAHPAAVRGKSVVELGAGLGVAGLTAAACCGARQVLLTDREPWALHCAASSAACCHPPLEQVQAAVLDWQDVDQSQLGSTVDVILASDVLYDGATIAAFCRACRRLCRHGTLLLTDPTTERYNGARQALMDWLGNDATMEVVELPLSPVVGTATTMDAKDHARRLQEPCVLLRCEW